MEANKRRIGICDTIFRDAHQSMLATRMKLEDILAVAEAIDKVGYRSLEVWGGATFDACLRFLGEDPWARLVRIKAYVKQTPLQMLLRGQNILGYKHYPDDVVREFAKKSVENGIDIVRIFDALNDVSNLRVAIEATKMAGGQAQATIVYTLSPVHDIDKYVDLGRRLAEMGADSLCIKDMAGILLPGAARELVGRLKEETKLPLQIHCHYTSGTASMTYLAAVEAGADVIDTALSALALGPSQPATESMVAALTDIGYDTGIDLTKLSGINAYFKKAKANYAAFQAPIIVDTDVLTYQIPGGMISNLRAQMSQQGVLDRLDEVLVEVPLVRADMGYPPLVTPMSQIIGTQAVLNVISGQRYSLKSKEIKDYVKGLYGSAPAPISDEIKAAIIGDEPVVTGRPADMLEPGLPAAKDKVREYMEKEEDVLTYIAFPELALEFFKKRQAAMKA